MDHCHVLLGGHMSDLHLAYVQASRSRETTHLFIDEAHAGPGMRDVVRSLSGTGRRTSPGTSSTAPMRQLPPRSREQKYGAWPARISLGR